MMDKATSEQRQVFADSGNDRLRHSGLTGFGRERSQRVAYPFDQFLRTNDVITSGHL